MNDQKEAFEERAAIIQFGSGIPSMTREESERTAAEQMGLTDDEAEFLMGAEATKRQSSEIIDGGAQKTRGIDDR
jgi:hypothetical protein